MRAMRAEQFSGYEGLLVDLPNERSPTGEYWCESLRWVTPHDYTILSGKFHGSKPLLVLGNEGAGVVEMGGGPAF